jgi:hypothetical protein
MSTRGLWLLLAAVVLASQTGCCCGGCWPCGKNYCGSQCGQLFWHEWFSIPPTCCEPCNCCGEFLGPKNKYVRGGSPPMGRPWSWGPDDMVTQAGYNGPMDGDVGPPPAEEVPPGRPMTGNQGGGYSRRASFDGPVDQRGGSRTLSSARRLSDYFR